MKKGALVLCGGKSSRMGRDKATLPFGPETMLQRVVRLLGEVVEPELIVVVAAGQQQLPPLPTSVRITQDEHPDRGPLEGLAAGLRAVPADVEAVYATSCDVPLLVPEFVNELFRRLGTQDIAVPRDGQFFHPLAAVYRPQILPVVLELLAADRLRPASLFDEVRTVHVAVEELRAADPELLTLLNLNRPEDYQAALVRAGLAS